MIAQDRQMVLLMHHFTQTGGMFLLDTAQLTTTAPKPIVTHLSQGQTYIPVCIGMHNPIEMGHVNVNIT